MTRPEHACREIIADSLQNVALLADRYVYPRQAMERAHRLIADTQRSVETEHWIGATDALNLLKVMFSGVPQASVRAEAFLDIDAAMLAVDEIEVLEPIYCGRSANVVPFPMRLRAMVRAAVGR